MCVCCLQIILYTCVCVCFYSVVSCICIFVYYFCKDICTCVYCLYKGYMCIHLCVCVLPRVATGQVCRLLVNVEGIRTQGLRSKRRGPLADIFILVPDEAKIFAKIFALKPGFNMYSIIDIHLCNLKLWFQCTEIIV